jgi:hypothetical protein
MSRTITLNVDDMLYEKFKKYARLDNRSLSNFFKTAADHYIENKVLADDFEMEEIRNNSELIKRMQAGSRDAANRNGGLAASNH